MRIATFPSLALVLLLPSVSHAQAMSVGQVCGQLIGTQVTQCLAAASGRHVDPNAAGVCSHLIGTQVISCIGAIAGKDFAPDQTNACSQLIGTQVVDCLRATGHPHRVIAPPPRAYYPPPAPPPAYPPRRGPLTVSEIRAEVAAALESLRANDPAGADRRLRHLLNDLR